MKQSIPRVPRGNKHDMGELLFKLHCPECSIVIWLNPRDFLTGSVFYKTYIFVADCFVSPKKYFTNNLKLCM